MSYEITYRTAADALSVIKATTEFLCMAVHDTQFLLSELAKQTDRLQNVELTFISVFGDVW